MICKECPHKQEYRRKINETKEVMCMHPDRSYIVQYFREHNIHKFEGFLGYVNSKGVFPIKKSPKWCPLKKEMAGDVNIATTTETVGES